MSGLHRFNSRKLAQKISSDSSNDTWKFWAGSYYDVYYSMYDKTRQEISWMRRLLIVLDKTLPKGWESQVVDMNSTGCMGEGVYCVDGELAHTLHMFHLKCRGCKILRRKDSFWCDDCKCQIESDDILKVEEIRGLEVMESLKRKTPDTLDEAYDLWAEVSLWFSDSVKYRFIEEPMNLLYDLLVKMITDSGEESVIKTAGRGFMVNGKPGHKLIRECYKCRIPFHLCTTEEAVYSVAHDGPFQKRKIWCAKCNNWTKLKKM